MRSISIFGIGLVSAGLGMLAPAKAQHLFAPTTQPIQSQPIQSQIEQRPAPATPQTPTTLQILTPAQDGPALDPDIPTVPIVPDGGRAPTDLEVLPTPANGSGETDITVIINSSRDLNRAKNLARQAAEIHNGGLQNYRAEMAMHTAGLAAPYTDQGDHWVFRFQGGAPGATVMTVESEVRVDKGTFRTEVLYNGPIRPQAVNP